jgi:glycosyltransferase involved in cell wall biosynthesis
VDSHNEGLKPYYGKYMKLFPVYRVIQQKADVTIVTNEGLARGVLNSGGKVFILPDKLPEFGRVDKVKLRGDVNLTFVCTFEKDEPFMEVLEAAALLDRSWYIYVTGSKGPAMREAFPALNLVFTGYLPDQDYVNLLYSSDGIIDLTKMEDCLVCGAYEGVALKKPLILSDTQTIRNYFRTGTIYTSNSSARIAEAIGKLVENKKELVQSIALLQQDLERDWKRRFVQLCETIENL